MRNFVTNMEMRFYNSIGGNEIDGVGVVVSLRFGNGFPFLVVMVSVLACDLFKDHTGVDMRSVRASRNIVAVAEGC